MFSNFKNTFINKPQYNSNIPQAVIAVISKDLPAGFKYVDEGKGICRLDAVDGLTIGSGNISLPQSAQSILPANPTMSDIWTYMYNSQRELEIKPDKDGYYIVNKEKIKADDFIKMPLKNVSLTSTIFKIVPPKFPTLFRYTIGTDDYSTEIEVQRVPYESMTIIKFESKKDNILSLYYTIDIESCQTSFTMDISIDKAKTVREIVESTHIFNAFIDGKGKFGNILFSGVADNINSKISDEQVAFWDKVYALETFFKVTFDPSEPITVDLVNIIEKLYHTFILKKPYKEYKDFDTLQGTGYNKISDKEDIIGTEIYFEMAINNEINIFNVTLKYVGIDCIFGATVSDFIIPDDNKKGDFIIKIKPTVGKKIFVSTMNFFNDVDLKEYRENKDHKDKLENAEELVLIE